MMIESGKIENPKSFWAAEPKTLGLKATLILMLYGFTMLGLYLGACTLSGHEAMRCEPAREMLLTGNWVIPHFNSIPAIQKPALVNWFIAASMKIFNSEAEWVCRFPSVFVTMLTAWMVAAMGARWHGRRIGLVSGLIFISSFYTIMQARLAEIDMILTLAVTAAIFCFILAQEDPQKQSKVKKLLLIIGFFGSTAVAFLAKLLIGPTMIAGGVIIYILLNRKWKAILFCLNPIGWIVFLGVSLPWFIAASNMNDDIFHRWLLENFGRFTRSHGTWGREYPLLFYFYQTPLIMMPWTLWLIGAVIYGFKRKMWRNANWNLIACFFIAALAILTASKWKHKHYIIPVLPPLAIPAAWYFVKNTFERIDKRQPVFFAPCILAVLSGVGIYFIWTLDVIPSDAVMPLTVLMVSVVVLFSTASILDYYSRPNSTIIVLFAAMWFVTVFFNGFVVSRFDEYTYEAELGKRVNAALDSDDTIYASLVGQTQIVYYLRWPIGKIGDVETMMQMIDEDRQDKYYMVIRISDIELFRPLGNVEILDEAEKERSNQESSKLAFVKFEPY